MPHQKCHVFWSSRSIPTIFIFITQVIIIFSVKPLINRPIWKRFVKHTGITLVMYSIVMYSTYRLFPYETFCFQRGCRFALYCTVYPRGMSMDLKHVFGKYFPGSGIRRPLIICWTVCARQMPSEWESSFSLATICAQSQPLWVLLSSSCGSCVN